MTERQMLPENPEIAHLMSILIKEVRGHVIEKPIGIKETADFFQVTTKTVHKWIATGEIPVDAIHYMGSRPYFLPSELNEILRKKRRK
jgi:hypothetical protein